MADKERKPVGEEEPRGSEEPRRAPGAEQEYQGGASQEKRAPGVEEDSRIEDDGGAKRQFA
jgi:hypothetical protein